MNLITQVSVEANVTDDQELLKQDVENIVGRMELDELWTDAGYEGEKARDAAEEHAVDHKLTAIKGKKSDRFTLDNFQIQEDEEGLFVSVGCPNGQCATVKGGNKPHRIKAAFDSGVCNKCPFSGDCPVRQLKKPIRILRFTYDEARAARQRRVAMKADRSRNIRAGVESTVRSVIHPFGGHLCKLPVRGKIRIAQMVILSAAMVNIRRIRLHEERKWSEMDSGWTSFCDLGRKWLYNFHSITITWLCRSTEVLKPPRWGCSLPR